MTCLLIFQGAYAINMQFSASDGGGNSVSISESYNVDNGVEVWGQSSAAFGEGLKIDDRRRFTGPGNIYAVQEYAGSGGYVGMSYIYAEDAAHTLARGSAHLTPGALGVVQDASIRDAGACAVVLPEACAVLSADCASLLEQPITRTNAAATIISTLVINRMSLYPLYDNVETWVLLLPAAAANI